MAGSHPERSEYIPIAIVGMGMRLPGSCNDAQSFWEFLINKQDGRKPIPVDRFNVKGFVSTSSSPESGCLPMDCGYFIDDDLSRFDPSVFSMSKAEVERVDPQQRLLLEVVYETLENAGEVDWRGKNIGVYTGSFAQDWMQIQAKDSQGSSPASAYRLMGMDDFVLANRVSYEFDLRGPSMSVKTGCSSAMVALHLACEALQQGSCSAAIVGGANLILTPEYTYALNDLHALSPDASVKAFDIEGNGYARADAVNAVYIKRLDDAVRDGNPIRAIIRATATNSDGKTQGLSNPSREAQVQLMRAAYTRANIANISETALVECHGTGTAAGDPTETGAIGDVFGEKGVYITSVKPNIGHGEAASGLSSIIKSVLALENKTIPPNIKFKTPNPKIPWSKSRLIVPTEPIPWPKGRRERISVNSFGIGGTNAHVILDSAASFLPLEAPMLSCPLPSHSLLVFSAHRQSALEQMIRKVDQFYQQGKGSMNHRDLAYTLGARRSHHQHRAFGIVSTSSHSIQMLSQLSETTEKRRGLLFVFTGQGAQWAGMGKELLEIQSFSDDINIMDHALRSLKEAPGWCIREELSKQATNSNVGKAEYAQPLCTAIQIALLNLLRIWKITPAAVIGHSSGEIGAAYAAGALTMSEAIIIAYYRGFVVARQTRRGGMAAVGLEKSEMETYLRCTSGVTIACENSDMSLTISGDNEKLEEVLSMLRADKPEVFARRLKVDRAYHSHHMNEIGDEYELLIRNIHPTKTQLDVPFYSTVTGGLITDPATFQASYWRRNLESPVLFHTTMQSALQSQHGPFHVSLEIGPHAALAGPLRQIYKQANLHIPHFSCLTRELDGMATTLSAMGELYRHGYKPDFEAMNRGGRMVTQLPSYSWAREQSYWHEPRVSREYRLRRFADHELLGLRILESTDLEPLWRKILRLNDVPWLRDHVVNSNIVFPAAGYITMAGEAIRQQCNIEEYTVRQVILSTALVLDETKSIEIVTRLQPHRLTNTLDSEWFNFSIASHNGASWNKHCVGQIRPGRCHSIRSNIDKDIKLPRQITASRWYQTMARVGLKYGPAFQGLDDICSAVTHKVAVATIVDGPRKDSSSKYALHPIALDQMFQSLAVAFAYGQPRLLNQLTLPTKIDELYVGCGSGVHIQIRADVIDSGNNVMIGNGTGLLADGTVVMDLTGMERRPLQSETPATTENESGAVQLEWRPAASLMDIGTLIQPVVDIKDCLELVEKLSVLCSIETLSKLGNVRTEVCHMQKFRDWNETRCVQLRTGTKKTIINRIEELFEMDSAQRQAMIDSLTLKAQGTRAAPVATAIARVYRSIVGIYNGSIDPLDILLKDDLLPGIYNFWDTSNYKPMIEVLCHENPNMRILEIGAGTGGFTSTILPALISAQGERMFDTYTLSDGSAELLGTAKEQFANYEDLEFAVLDINSDPAGQGFELQSYDLVIAANVTTILPNSYFALLTINQKAIHETRSLVQTLTHCRALLRPSGCLFLQELCAGTKWVNFIMGTLPGWWLGESDGRQHEPYVNISEWDVALQKAGFTGVETSIFDQEAPYQLNVHIVSRPAPDTVKEHPNKLALLVSDQTPTNHATEKLKEILVLAGYDVDVCSLFQELPRGVDIISVLDIESGPFFKDITEAKLKAFIAAVSSFSNDKRGILWITPGVQIEVKDPHYALMLGTARTVRQELGARFATLELDSIDTAACEVSVKVFERLMKSGRDFRDHVSWEYALVNGVVYVPRYREMDIAATFSSSILRGVTSPADNTTTKKLKVQRAGLLQTLGWAEDILSQPGPDQIEVEVRAASLNFRDILVAMGIVRHNAGEHTPLGIEFAGIVRKVGTSVDQIHIGDRVVCWAPGALATRVTVPKTACLRIPNNLTFEEASSMPTVYGTAIRSIMEIGRLTPNQSILIHSGAGGLGLAAIQIAQVVGAEIYATVGNEAKIEHLVTHCGIRRDHIFHSRDNSFVAGVMHATKGKGIDLVLNSLSGELLHESWKCVAEYGTMVELGKRDMIGQGQLALDRFLANRAFYGVDVFDYFDCRPQLIQELLIKILELFEQGQISPTYPIKTFEAADVEQAFRYLQKGQNIGKVVVTFPGSGSDLRVSRSLPTLRLRPDCSYLLVGGLGGLGKATAIWLAEHGATHLIFVNRRGKKGTDQGFFEELDALACSVQVFSGSVADLAFVQRVVEKASKPIAGVLQMSMVLRDGEFSAMTLEDWDAVTAPKVQGTWNLHRCLDNKQLDFFVLYSSVSGAVGQPGQTNYAAANSFLDAFVSYRQRLGLVASAISIGVMEDIGYVSNTPALLEGFRRVGAQMVREKAYLEALHLAILQSASSPGCVVPTRAYINPGRFGIGMASGLFAQKRGPAHTGNKAHAGADPAVSKKDTLGDYIESIITAKAIDNNATGVELIARHIANCVHNFLADNTNQDPDLSKTPAAIGVDSLVAIELRAWWRQHLRSEVSTLELMSGRNFLQLGELALYKLLHTEQKQPTSSAHGMVYRHF
ncbi:putative polyketide synthase [Xylogone sp. PMI_703]|nr:putative polyketide synthase [Xylogone sp. PMI_703]